MTQLPITNRVTAGRKLAAILYEYKYRDDVIVLALPRGGVPVAYEIAQSLHVPLDVMVVRKLGFPAHKEYAMGAIASGGVRVLIEDIVRGRGISEATIEKVVADEKKELDRREQTYRSNRPWPDLHRKCVILVDDGMATGATMRAAISAVRQQGATKIVIAVPVAPLHTAEELAHLVEDTIFLATPSPFYAVGQWYQDFGQTSDNEVIRLLNLRWNDVSVTN